MITKNAALLGQRQAKGFSPAKEFYPTEIRSRLGGQNQGRNGRDREQARILETNFSQPPADCED
jgi:hypothetical protein